MSRTRKHNTGQSADKDLWGKRGDLSTCNAMCKYNRKKASKRVRKGRLAASNFDFETGDL